MLNEHPDFVPNQPHERLRASALLTQETRKARLNGRVFGYQLVVERPCVLVVDDDHDNADSLTGTYNGVRTNKINPSNT